MNAYRVQDYQISAPDWMSDLRFDIVAKIPRSADPGKMPEMIRTLLAERFKLKIHVEQKEFSGYALVLGPGAPKLSKPGDEAEGKLPPELRDLPPQPLILHQILPTGGQRMTGVHATMTYLAQSLAGDMGYPVVDLTNLTGGYDFVVEMSREDMRNGVNAGARGPEGEDPGASVFSSIQGLGLRLRPHKIPLDLIVVDHAEKVPTEN
jgi:uncharacterized protein (TIGR03435 family)